MGGANEVKFGKRSMRAELALTHTRTSRQYENVGNVGRGKKWEENEKKKKEKKKEKWMSTSQLGVPGEAVCTV